MRTAGFSLVECVVATVVLAAGLLAIVASERAMQRLEALGRRTAEAAEAAAGRMSLMRATGCVAPASDSASGVLIERWSVSGGGPMRAASVSVEFTHDARKRLLRFDATFECGAAP